MNRKCFSCMVTANELFFKNLLTTLSKLFDIVLQKIHLYETDYYNIIYGPSGMDEYKIHAIAMKLYGRKTL